MSKAKNLLSSSVEKITQGESISTGITLGTGRESKMRLKREHDSSGFETYIIESMSRRETLKVPRYLFEFFKNGVSKTIKSFEEPDFYEFKIEFKGKEKIRIEKKAGLGVQISAIDEREGTQGTLLLSQAGLLTLNALIHDERVKHGSDVLKRILAYHKLFKFTFSEASESLNSGLSLRMDVLSQIEDYVPPVGKRVSKNALNLALTNVESKDALQHKVSKQNAIDEKKIVDAKVFKSRLAERDGGKAWKVDYQALFSNSSQRSFDRQPKVNTGEESKRDGAPRHTWLLPILSSEIKMYRSSTWRCELSVEDIKLMRDSFLEARDSEYYLGFDVIDAIFKAPSGKLRTFRFPLYYMPVEIEESGRVIILNPRESGRFYLNHLAIATLVETFSPESNPETAITDFFETLLAQKIEVDGRLGRVYLSRTLPCSEEVFDRTREVVLGLPGENGKGGLFGTMEILGAECDTDAIFLYKASKVTSPLQRALELDLEVMQDAAERTTERFIKTIPGRFLASGSGQRTTRVFAKSPFVPAFLPQSTRRLMDKLNHHDIVLLEGPPGTGKTHTIMNLLIHAVCSGQRILIVSDQEAAIHALAEKLEGYLSEGKPGNNQDAISIWKRAVKMVDRVQGGYTDLGVFCRTIEECLNAGGSQEVFRDQMARDNLEAEIQKVDKDVLKCKEIVSRIMSVRLGPGSDLRKRVSPKRGHATTTDDVSAFVSFLKFMGGGLDSPNKKAAKQAEMARRIVRKFVISREYLSSVGDPSLYSWFAIPEKVSNEDFNRIDQAFLIILKLMKLKPKSVDQLKVALTGHTQGRIPKHLIDMWTKLFPQGEGALQQMMRVVQSVVHHPAKGHLKSLVEILRDQKLLLDNFSRMEPGVWRQLIQMHEALAPGFKGVAPLSLEVCRFATSKSFVFGEAVNRVPAIQEQLERLEILDARRSELVRKLFLSKLSQVLSKAHESVDGGSNAVTQISSMLHGLKNHENIESGVGVWRELQSKMIDTFPIWLCRKQAVSFLFPCKEKLFDLVIVDEATQCRVDDALPLMYRARKVMVVGDDKQTVLAKNSVIDDYLFKEFNLDEHLRGTQARGIKGGGSHIFGLVKGIKEGGVMLDEHYRCPPAIIEYSNRYVYNSDLKVMQWKRSGQSPSVVIDWSERDMPESGKPDSGAFKGIETEMVDRFFNFVERSVKEIERETGKRVNMEQDVALCYFLLKNEPYVKSKKAEFLAKLGRGDDVLDGAGAALQGKERPYIFYLWDISRANVMAFRQGDDPDKRKGELNVLMSRPKRKAFHFLHKRFDELDHDKASITDFLWNAWKVQQEGESKKAYVERSKQPSSSFIPWRRSSGSLIEAILLHLEREGVAVPVSKTLNQTGIVVGDPRFKVDIALTSQGSTIGVVDLCGFEWHDGCADDVVDYYFQLKRAEPKVNPVFLFMHELADVRSRAFMRLLSKFSN